MERLKNAQQQEMDTQGMMQGLGNQTASVGCIACEMVYENRKSWGATSGMCLDCYMKRNYGATRAEAPKRKEEPKRQENPRPKSDLFDIAAPMAAGWFLSLVGVYGLLVDGSIGGFAWIAASAIAYGVSGLFACQLSKTRWLE